MYYMSSLAISSAGLLQTLHIPLKIWEDISMDCIKGLAKSSGFDSILVEADGLSKYAHFPTLEHPFTTSIVAAIFVKEVFKLHGIPCSIISGLDKNSSPPFLSKTLRAIKNSMCELVYVKQHPYRLRSLAKKPMKN